MYELIQVAENSYYIQSPAKIGLVLTGEGEVCLIDSGSDKSAAKKVRKILDANGWKLKAIYNTHSHADHIGGNRYLQEQTGCRIYAPGIERDFTEHPVLEPPEGVRDGLGRHRDGGRRCGGVRCREAHHAPCGRRLRPISIPVARSDGVDGRDIRNVLPMPLPAYGIRDVIPITGITSLMPVMGIAFRGIVADAPDRQGSAFPCLLDRRLRHQPAPFSRAILRAYSLGSVLKMS